MCVCVDGRCVYEHLAGGFLVVAAHDDTCVELYVIAANGKYQLKGSYFMKQFQLLTYTTDVRNDAVPMPVYQYDATGIFVNSSKPIAVYGGHSCAHVPSRDIYFCDHIVEQIPPVAELGTTHVVPPIMGRSNDYAGYDHTLARLTQ